MAVEAANAYYLKLGRGGLWAEDSITTGKARIGWLDIPLPRIHAQDFNGIKADLQRTAKSVGAGTADANALECFCRSTEEDVWITFHRSRLWWGRLKNGPVLEDATSKYRLMWSWHQESAKGAPLLVNQLPGRIAQLQGYRATICRVREKEALLRLLSGERSPEYLAILAAQEQLASKVVAAIQRLHWKDFELLVDLVFRQSGWRRTSTVGETMKFVDIELEDTLTGDKYQVQVKSTASLSVAEDYRRQFADSGYRKLYFVVHSPEPTLQSADLDDDRFELIRPERLGRMVVDAGLTRWLLDRVA